MPPPQLPHSPCRQQQEQQQPPSQAASNQPSAEQLYALQQEAKRKLRKVEEVQKGPVVVKVLASVDVLPSGEHPASRRPTPQ